MYRAPEMIDLYSNSPINEKSDIWVSAFISYITWLLLINYRRWAVCCINYAFKSIPLKTQPNYEY